MVYILLKLSKPFLKKFWNYVVLSQRRLLKDMD